MDLHRLASAPGDDPVQVLFVGLVDDLMLRPGGDECEVAHFYDMAFGLLVLLLVFVFRAGEKDAFA